MKHRIGKNPMAEVLRVNCADPSMQGKVGVDWINECFIRYMLDQCTITQQEYFITKKQARNGEFLNEVARYMLEHLDRASINRWLREHPDREIDMRKRLNENRRNVSGK